MSPNCDKNLPLSSNAGKICSESSYLITLLTFSKRRYVRTGKNLLKDLGRRNIIQVKHFKQVYDNEQENPVEKGNVFKKYYWKIQRDTNVPVTI